MSYDSAAYAAGLAQGRQDFDNRVSSPAPPEYANNKDYADGYTKGFAIANDPEAYFEGEEAGRSDRIHHVSSTPPPAYDPETHYNDPGTSADSYAKGYEDGSAAAPYRQDVEDEEAAEQEARARSLRASMPSLSMDPTSAPQLSGQPVGPSMSSLTEGQEEADKRYTENKEATEQYLHLREEWQDELKRTTPEDVTGTPLGE